MELEQIQKFHGFLQNDLNMFEDEAFEVIYYLQEVLHIIPDKFELCNVCGTVYDSNSEGYFSNETGGCCDWCDTGERDKI